ncbi:hypothetical protein VNO77_06598 [Canavalia gladiata]|uniref:Uncharacterized protein n=1 Tax=Canavalia gladiata TaxID=3824 RepID=A0AAN9M7K7_CANGL
MRMFAGGRDGFNFVFTQLMLPQLSSHPKRSIKVNVIASDVSVNRKGDTKDMRKICPYEITPERSKLDDAFLDEIKEKGWFQFCPYGSYLLMTKPMYIDDASASKRKENRSQSTSDVVFSFWFKTTWHLAKILIPFSFRSSLLPRFIDRLGSAGPSSQPLAAAAPATLSSPFRFSYRFAFGRDLSDLCVLV